MISKKAKYGLLALVALAKRPDRLPVLISDLAQSEGIPKKFLELILLELKNHGILQSKKGKGGGYFIGKPLEQISLGTVIRILDGPIAPVPCVSQTAYMKCDECKDETTCGLRLVMKELRDTMAVVLDGTTLADVRERLKDIDSEDLASLTYCI